MPLWYSYVYRATLLDSGSGYRGASHLSAPREYLPPASRSEASRVALVVSPFTKQNPLATTWS